MRNVLIFGILAILIILAGWYVFRTDATRNQNQHTGDNATTTEPIVGDYATWETYESAVFADRFGFTLRHPQEVTAKSSTGDVVSFPYIGPENKPNTEIVDGFLFTVQFEVIAADTTLALYAQNRRNLQADTIAETKFTERDAIRFTTTSELDGSDVPHVVVRLNDTTVAIVSYIISGDTDGRYQNTVNRMMDSLAFSERETGDADASVYDEVSLAMLTDPSDTPERGCDDVVMVSVAIEPTTAPLTAALNQLFTIDTETYEGNRNFIARTNDTLAFDRAVVKDGTAHVYLTGELSGLAGVCDNPRAAIQIEETALQFATVNAVQLYLDDVATDLIPSERGE